MLQKLPKSLTIYLCVNIIVYATLQIDTDFKVWQMVELYAVTPSKLSIFNSYVLVSHAFMHLGGMHLVLNCLWALVFGTIVARNVSFVQFWLFVFYVAVISGLGYFALNMYSLSPMLGASGVVSGFMGAAIHCFPAMYDRSGQFHVSTSAVQLPNGYANAVRTLFRFKPAVNMILMVHGLNIIAALAPQLLGSSAPIAWEVHLIGFWAGILMAPLFFESEKK